MDTAHTETDKAKSQSAIDAATEYWTDAWQRSFLTLEALNERGNIHLAQLMNPLIFVGLEKA
jgi:hypothetical protein